MPGKILLIDDDKLMRRSLAFNLEQAGFSTFTAQDAETGINLVEQHQPDLIILDIGLPGMDGLEALKIFRDQMGLPVILLTARRRGMDEILGLELGADDYITKPFEFDILLAHVNLSPKEFDLLYLLATNAGKVLAADDILARVWGAEFEGQPQVVYVHIRWLREKLGESAQSIPRIQTIRGVGYKYNPQEN
jgi:DNA-binding response OmpR family regulator